MGFGQLPASWALCTVPKQAIQVRDTRMNRALASRPLNGAILTPPLIPATLTEREHHGERLHKPVSGSERCVGARDVEWVGVDVGAEGDDHHRGGEVGGQVGHGRDDVIVGNLWTPYKYSRVSSKN